MATADVQLSLSQADHSTLDSLLHTHLRLEPLKSQDIEGASLGQSVLNFVMFPLSKVARLQVGRQQLYEV